MGQQLHCQWHNDEGCQQQKAMPPARIEWVRVLDKEPQQPNTAPYQNPVFLNKMSHQFLNPPTSIFIFLNDSCTNRR